LKGNIDKLPLPRSSGSPWTTTALPIMECGPVRGICLSMIVKVAVPDHTKI